MKFFILLLVVQLLMLGYFLNKQYTAIKMVNDYCTVKKDKYECILRDETVYIMEKK